MTARRQLNLNLFLYGTGHHEASWRHPWARPEELFTAAYYQGLARRAEDALLDAVFFADVPALGRNIAHGAAGHVEPLTTLASIAAVTSRIGLIATASTTFYEPYNLARLFSSLDHLSGGRAGWNIVTTGSDAAAGNFGLDTLPDTPTRYARGDEFVDAVTRLWDSWEDDAVVGDIFSGTYASTERIHDARFRGQHVSVAGALNAPRSPQGYPVLVQAGSSDEGRGFAARHAEAIFTAHQRLEDGLAFAADIRSRAAALGRNPAHIKILPGISPIIGSTEAEARDLANELNALTVPAYGIQQLESLTGTRFDEADLDRPVPLSAFAGAGDVTSNSRSRLQVVAGIVERERPTLRTLLHRLAGARGHRVVAGTAEQIAATIEEWFEAGAADGFNVMPPVLPAGLDAFVDEVVPILQDRGLFRTAYTGTTLREHYGLPRPENQFAVARAEGTDADDSVAAVA